MKVNVKASVVQEKLRPLVDGLDTTYKQKVKESYTDWWKSSYIESTYHMIDGYFETAWGVYKSSDQYFGGCVWILSSRDCMIKAPINLEHPVMAFPPISDAIRLYEKTKRMKHDEVIVMDVEEWSNILEVVK